MANERLHGKRTVGPSHKEINLYTSSEGSSSPGGVDIQDILTQIKMLNKNHDIAARYGLLKKGSLGRKC